MQFVKTNLKSAKQAISTGKYEEALYYSEAVLENDPKNYNALLFVGKAADVLKESEKSEKAYNTAIKEQPENPLAWKGLAIHHEELKNFNAYLDCFVGLVKCYEQVDDIHGAGDAFIKATKFLKRGDAEAVRVYSVPLKPSITSKEIKKKKC